MHLWVKSPNDTNTAATSSPYCTHLAAEDVLLPQVGLQGEDRQHGPYRERVRAWLSNGVPEGDLVGKVAGGSAPGVPVVPDC